MRSVCLLVLLVFFTRDGQGKEANCIVEETSGDPSQPIYGTVQFSQLTASDPVSIWVLLKGFNYTDDSQIHGFHVHQAYSLGNQCRDAQGHFNPFNTQHGSPTSNEMQRHVGDLGNIQESADGSVEKNFTDSIISLIDSERSILGRSIVIHANRDDLGQGGDAGSLATGNAGPRIACCQINEVPPQIATCIVRPETGDTTKPISGFVRFVQNTLSVNNRDLNVEVSLDGFEQAGQHGFHVHASGVLTNQCRDATGHYNPLNATHGARDSAVRHLGDFGNIQANSRGEVREKFSVKDTRLDGPTSIIGRAIVIHGGVDDLGQGGDDGSLASGNAGPRIACCKIETGDNVDQVIGGASIIAPPPLWFLLSIILLKLSLH